MSLVLEDSKVSLARKVMKVQGVSMVPLVQLVFRGYLAHQVKRVKQVMLGRWVHLALQDPEAHLVLQGQMVHKVLQEELVTLELWARRVTLVKPDPLDLQDTWECQGRKANGVRKVNLDHLVLLGLQDLKVLLVTMVLRAALDRLVSLVTLALLVNPDLRVKMDLQETREKMVNLDRLVLLVQLVRQDRLVLQERGVLTVLQVLREDKERKGQRVTLVLKVLLARQVQWAHKDLQENPALRGCEEFQARSVSKVSQDPPARQAHPAPWVRPDCQASRVTLVQRARRVIRV